MLLNKTEQLFHKDLLGTETKPAKHTHEEKEDNPANDTWQKNKGIPQINVWHAVQRENTEQKHSVNLQYAQRVCSLRMPKSHLVLMTSPCRGTVKIPPPDFDVWAGCLHNVTNPI